jgi:hypothetical protein
MDADDDAKKKVKEPVPAYQPQQFISDGEAAALLGLSHSYMRKLRVFGGGPRYSCLGANGRGAIRYRVADLLAWAEERSATSTSDAA